MDKIDSKICIKDLIEKYPLVIDIFKMYGFDIRDPKDALDKFGEKTMLQTILKVKNLNIPLFLDIVENKIDEKEEMSDFYIKTISDETNLNLFGCVPCPIKLVFKQNLERLIYKYKEYTGKLLKCYIPCGHSKNEKYSSMWKIKNIDEFPDILISFGFENYFNIEFFHNLVEKRYFKSVWEGTNINSNFSNLGCVDNDGGYTIYSVSPYILLVDKKKLGGFKVPKRWSDLFKDEYRNNIIVEGGPKSVSAAVLHYIYKDYGEKGLKMLAHNVKDIWDAAKMAKIAGMSGNKGAAVYIIPWFFAKCCGRHDEDIIIIWPEDGAFIYPLYMMIKRSKWTEFHEIVKLITGKNFGNQCAKGCCPSLNPYVNNRLPENSSFRWIGWEYIRKNDFQKIRELANSIFMETWMNNK